MGAVTNNSPRQQPTRQQQTNISKELCWRCGGIFSPGHITQCTAKQAICSICKKTGHFAKMCRSKSPPPTTTKNPIPRRISTSPGIVTKSATRKRQIQESLIEEKQSDQAEEETIDPDSTLYIQELTDDWADVNHIIPKTCTLVRNSVLNKSKPEETWVETKISNNQTVKWLADTGSPRSFLTLDKAKELIISNPNLSLQPYNGQTQYGCFNNNNIKIEGTLQLTLKSGSWTAKDCQILVVQHKTNNLMGRDILQKLGITLQQRPTRSPGNYINSISHIKTEKNIIKWILKKYPYLSSRIGKSKNHITNSILKENHTPIQQKGRRVPLDQLEKVEIEFGKLIQNKQITR